MATNYYPSPVPENTEDLRRYINDELQRIRDEFDLMSDGGDTLLDISRGLVRGVSHINKFGINNAIADGTEETVWSASGAYTFSTTADITHIVSSAAETQLIEIQGLDTNWNEVTQTKALTGTTGVALDTPLIRVYRLKVLSAVTNAGVVQCGVGAVTTSFAAGNLRAQIEIGFGQTLMAIYSVPAGYTAYLTKYYASIVGESGPPAVVPDYVVFNLFTIDNVNGHAPRIGHVVGASLIGTSLVEHAFQPYPAASEKTDIYLTAKPDGDDASVSAGFDIILVANA